MSTTLGWDNLSLVAMSAGKLAVALDASLEAVRAARSGSPAARADARMRLANAWYHIGDAARAERHARHACELLRGGEDPRVLHSSHLLLGHCHRLRQLYGQASAEYEESIAIAQRSGSSMRVQETMAYIADLHLTEGRPDAALDAACQAMDAVLEELHPVSQARAKTQYGRALHRLGRTDEAIDSLVQAHWAVEQTRSPLLIAEVAEPLAACYLARGDVAYFVHYVNECLDAFDIAATDLESRALKRTFLQDPRRRGVFEMAQQAEAAYGL